MFDLNVSSMPLAETLKEIEEELLEKDQACQEIQTAVRKARRLSKRAIFLIHKDELDEAEKTLREAKGSFAELNDLSRSFPDLIYMGSVDSAFQEYAEAQILLGLVKERRFVDYEEINVPAVSYVLGLADVIGEVRRRTLDSLKKGETEKAEECLDLMETIFAELINLDDIQFLIKGLRRKCDIGRRVIEATRGDVTVAVRRSLLEDSIKELKKTLEAKREE
jgi:translin